MEVFLNGKPLYINFRMMYYRNHLGYVYHEPWKWQPKKKPVAGWCSWEAFRRDIDQKKIDEVCSFMEKKLKDYGLEYIQVDDGFQEMPLPCNPDGDMAEGWLTCNPQAFPKGHKGIVDGINAHGFTPAIWTNANITNVEFAEKHKDNLILHNGGPMNEVIGVADACRIAMDANPTWAGVRMQLFEMARWFHAQSDTLDAYSEEKLDVIRKTLPPLDTRTGEAGALSMEYPAYTWTKLHGFAVQSHETPVEMEDVSLEEAYAMAGNYPSMDDDHPFSTLWSFGLERGGANWHVVGRFATVPLRESTIDLDILSVDPIENYYAFDFWKQKFLGIVTGSLFCRELEVGCCQIIGLREVTGVPQFIASSRHVSMDAVSVLRESWDEKQDVLCLTLAGIQGTKQRYYIAVPDTYVWKNGEAVNGSAEFCLMGNLLHVEVGFADREVCLKLCFGKR